MQKIIQYKDGNNITRGWDSLNAWCGVLGEMVELHVGRLAVYQDSGTPLHKLTVQCTWTNFLGGELNQEIENWFDKKTVDEIKQSIFLLSKC